MASHDVVARVRKLLKQKQVRPTVALSVRWPAARTTHLRCAGDTRDAQRYLSKKQAEPITPISSSASFTDSCGAERGIVRTTDTAHLTLAQIEEALPHFLGEQMQVPPRYSAIKLQGQPAYKRARAGEEIVLEPRPVVISQLEIHAWQSPHLTLAIECSKGTYIRSLAYDLGERLGCGAHLAALVRTRSGPFSLAESITLEQLAAAVEAGNAATDLHPIDSALQQYPVLQLDDTARVAMSCTATRSTPRTIADIFPLKLARVYYIAGQSRRSLNGMCNTGMWQPKKGACQRTICRTDSACARR